MHCSERTDDHSTKFLFKPPRSCGIAVLVLTSYRLAGILAYLVVHLCRTLRIPGDIERSRNHQDHNGISVVQLVRLVDRRDTDTAIYLQFSEKIIFY